VISPDLPFDLLAVRDRTTCRRAPVWVALGALLIGLSLTPAVSAAPEPTRPDYVAQLEQICKPAATATERASSGVKADIQAERLRIAAAKFRATGRIFSRTLERIAPIPRPLADRSKLAEWFGYLAEQERYLERITTALADEKPIATQRYTARFVHNGKLANRTVLAFGFRHCLFDFARYG
jgi:hypothetical protein